MDNNVEFPTRDDQLTAMLRELHAPPGGEAYWPTLENRILSYVAEGGDQGWWQAFEGWTRPALVAAALILTVVGLTLNHLSQPQAEFAFFPESSAPTLLEDTPEVHTQHGVVSPRDRSFGYVIRH